jgi:hypothetical protein
MMTVNTNKIATATMTLRHAAALALVGWYVMVSTSFTVTPKGTIWGPMKRLIFDSYKNCEDYKQDVIAAFRHLQFPLDGFPEARCTQFEDRLAN